MNLETAKQEVVNRILSAQGAHAPYIVAVDGRCAAGKTTFANEVAKITGSAVVHMDDFFLQPYQRTQQRLAIPGENVDWERFKREVLLPLSRGETAYFRPFDCHTLGFLREISANPQNGVIVEGTYSLHKALFDFYSFRVFLHVSPKEQLQRIRKRNGESGAKVFAEKWIPLEETYYSAYDLKNRCDFVVNTD